LSIGLLGFVAATLIGPDLFNYAVGVGTVSLECNDPGVQVELTKDDNTTTRMDASILRQMSLPAGDYQVRVEAPPNKTVAQAWLLNPYPWLPGGLTPNLNPPSNFQLHLPRAARISLYVDVVDRPAPKLSPEDQHTLTLAGTWDCSGVVFAFQHEPFDELKPIAVTGSIAQVTVITGGNYDPAKRTLDFKFSDPQSNFNGTAKLHLSADGNKLEGAWSNSEGKQGIWTMLRREESEPLPAERLAVGQVAPEIDAEDIDGTRFKLSDYRGKVVVLCFWGDWCPPCREMYVQDRWLIENLKNKPFAFIGVNSDPDKEKVKQVVQKEQIPWRSFWNGPKATRGPISTRWGITAWPTIFVLDDHGMIRFKNVRGEAVDEAVEKLLAELENAPKPTPDGFVPLFNGKDLTGWKKHLDQPGNWRVENGILIGSGPSRVSHLFSERSDYANFHLRAEAKINKAGNSGIYFRTPFGLNRLGVYPPGYEAQIFVGDKAALSDNPEPQKTGSLFNFVPYTKIPPGADADQWFTMEIIAYWNRITIKVNNTVTVDNYVDKNLAFTSGHIALQQAGPETVVQFRKIEIKELRPDEDNPASPPWPFNADKAKELQEACAKKLSVPVEQENSIGMKLRLIPPGKFTMAKDYNATITKPFRIGIYEVTVGQFRAFIQETEYKTDAEKSVRGGHVKVRANEDGEFSRDYTWKHPDVSQGDKYPVGQLSWYDAVKFCQWLSEKEKKTYRLPTEAEWAWACRAGNAGIYQFGDDQSKLGEYAWFAENSGGRTHPVGEKKPNAWGLFDMHGNVCEYCQDWHEKQLPAGDAVDPTGPSEGKFRALRSSSFFDTGNVGVNRRGAYSPHQCMNHFGFRVLCEMTPMEKLLQMPALVEPNK
ncbi:MAG TPA: SUMF1/EgtB/PvdO family nonheme iron enzyme, partial [Gemmataceae bacterium]|nr:SUMF1/EgtB/PvdO family nonheme iron enzyme [Gemmataceae bacterium]